MNKNNETRNEARNNEARKSTKPNDKDRANQKMSLKDERTTRAAKNTKQSDCSR